MENKTIKKLVMKISELNKSDRRWALERQKVCTNSSYNKTTDELNKAFDWGKTIEGHDYWQLLYDSEVKIKEANKEEPKHYNNSKGSLYKFCDDNELNPYEFDIIKRVMRCRKKGLFLEDLEKTKFLIDLYIKEQI